MEATYDAALTASVAARVDAPSPPSGGEGALPPDATLVSRLRAGDADAFAAVVGRYQRSMTRVARTWVRTEHAAEEVVQDVWLAVIRGLHRFEGRSSFKTWLFRIVVNRATSRALRDRRQVPFSSFQGEDGLEWDVDGPFTMAGAWAEPVAAWPVPSAEQLTLQAELVALVAAAVEQLPAAQRVVLTMRDIEGLDSADVCTVLGVSAVHQRVLLHRARTAVRAAVHGRMTAPSTPPA
ncbi:MAG: RNA polymerase sigma factor [Vicinamibacterales bacterium]